MPQSSSNDLSDLFEDTLKDIYFAEKQILRALPKMAKAASSPQLREAFEAHRQETEGHVERLEQIFEKLGKAARGKTCDAILGIIDESKEIMEEYQGKSALDAGLAAAGQAVEHYEMARYGTLKTWATQLGMADAAKLLDQTLQEEKAADEFADQASDRGRQQKSGIVRNLRILLGVLAGRSCGKLCAAGFCAHQEGDIMLIRYGPNAPPIG
jgi:ferritin-like metal-binding protein YciE